MGIAALNPSSSFDVNRRAERQIISHLFCVPAEISRDGGERLDHLGLQEGLQDEFGYQGLLIEMLNKDLRTLIISNGYQGRYCVHCPDLWLHHKLSAGVFCCINCCAGNGEPTYGRRRRARAHTELRRRL
jgi:hypothetical protein